MEGPARQLPRGPKLGWGGPGNTFGPTNITGMSPNKPGLVFEPGVAKLLRAGHDIILVEVVAHYDNSPGNKYNPDPTKDVKWGDQTWEEMMIGFWGSVVDASAASGV